MRKNILRMVAVILSLILSFGFSFNVFAENINSWKNKIDDRIYTEIENKSDKIPVYIWLEDVEHDEVIAETENTLGYGESDLAVIDENMSEQLAADIAALSENSKDKSVSEEIREYMDKTKEKREKEKEKTDKYISEKRKNYKEKYNENSKGFLDKAKISEEDIVFISEYAPMVIAELTIDQIESIAKIGDVAEIYCRGDEEERYFISYELAEITSVTKVDYIHETLGITGAGVKVGIRDVGIFTTSAELPSDRFISLKNGEDEDEDHIVAVAKVFCGENGIAPDAKCYLVSDCDSYSDIEKLLDAGVSVINISLGSYHSNEIYYNNEEKWTDHVANIHNVSITHSAGNTTGEILSPGLAFNVITVGGYNTKATISTNDDIMYPKSAYNNFTGCLKPDLIAPAYFFNTTGTSFSAPYVAGIIALMLELRPSLAAFPQAIKAILLASCHHKALPATGTSNSTETMAQGLTDKQGAGVVDPYRAISIVGRGNYGIRTMTDGTGNITIKFKQPLYDASGLNVSIAWLRGNTISSTLHSSGSDVTAGIAHNLDLSLLSGSTVLKTSANTNSSTEMVYYSSPSSTENYTIKIDKVNSDSGTVRVGYAWSVDTEKFQCTDEYEGIYYLKNSVSGYYLTLNSSTEALSQSSSTLGTQQQWVIQKSTSGGYRINSVYGNTGCLNVGAVKSGNYYNNVLDTDNTADITVKLHNDGALSFYKTISGVKYYLAVENNSTANNASVVWLKCETASDLLAHYKWYAEQCSYRKGDVNLDGDITAADAQDALSYSGGTMAFSNVQIYLADVDNDKSATASDARTILRMSAGLE